MIVYRGYEDLIDNVYKFKHQHIFDYWDELNDNDRNGLLLELSRVDFELMDKLFIHRKEGASGKLNFDPAPFVSLPKTTEEVKKYEKAKEAGTRFIRAGKTAALIVAGGQGTRLGFDGPKGMFPAGPVSGKSLFRIFAEKILKYSEKYAICIPWLIMTSTANHEDTVVYFEENSYFGLDKKNVIFFTQNMIPSLDMEGRLILKSKNSVFMNPDGHGGTLSALYSSGALDELKSRGIEVISYFQVDNPLIKIIDPVFIGFHILNDSDVSSKAVRKVSPEEKVGVFVKYENGKMGLVEYSEMSSEEQNAVDDEGNLIFCPGNPAIHLFKRSFIEEITSGSSISLPYHLAKKKIKSFKGGKGIEIDGYKFEKFIFDSLSLTGRNTILETVREEEFAPVKNKSGSDSADTSRHLMSNLSRAWFLDKNINIPDKVSVIEISPLLAVEPDDLGDDIVIPDEEMVYLE